MKKQNIIFIIIIFLFLVSVGVASFIFINKIFKQEKMEVKQESIQKEKPAQEMDIPKEQLQFEQTGVVEEINSDSLIVKTHKEVAPGINELTVLMTLKTEITKLILTKNPQEKGLKREDFVEENGSISDIKLGDMVIIVTNEDVEGKTKIEALRIKVVKREF